MQHHSGRARRASRRFSFIAALGLVAMRLAIGVAPAAAVGGTYVVNTNGDQPDAFADGRCFTGIGTCTLRAALTEADRDVGPSRIEFAIPGTGVHTINITSSLPELREGGTTIDGYTQPGSAPNADALVSNAQLKVEVRGTGPTSPAALVATSPNNVVQGLAIYNLGQDIRLINAGATDNVLRGNFLGTNAAGTFNATTGGGFGVVLNVGASRNRIGGPSPADRNVISGNSGRAILLCSPLTCDGATGANDNTVQNNIIGLTPNGAAARPNLGHGIDVNAGSSRNLITGNVVSGNNAAAGSSGIEVSHGVTTVDNRITNNRVGTNPAGTAGPDYARNNQPNIHIEDGPKRTIVEGNVIGNSNTGGIKINSLDNPVTGTIIRNNRIGISTTGAAISNGPYGIQLEDGGLSPMGTLDTVVGPGNIITANAAGVRIMDDGTVRNRITANSIYGNTELGIDIAPLDAVNQNDAGDADTGPNQMQNFPVLSSPTPTSVKVMTCPGCRVEVFISDSTTTDPSVKSSYGEGRTFLAGGTADGNGNATVTFAAASSPRTITATATDPAGNTSEFSLNTVVPAQSNPK